MGRPRRPGKRRREPMAQRATQLRKDPVNRSAGASPVFLLKDKDPSRVYCWVYLATPADGQGPDYYEYLGYRREVWSADGPKPQGMKFKDGDEIVVRGHVLMSCDERRYRDIVQYGPEGETGQAGADKLEKNLIKRRGGFDPLRGLTGLHGRGGSPV